jgi:hypothetical protein
MPFVFVHVHVEEFYCPHIFTGKIEKGTDCCRFACAVGSDKTGNTSFRQRKRNVVK